MQKEDDKVNLCDSCRHQYPGCPAGVADIEFGDGFTDDNICGCSEYEMK